MLLLELNNIFLEDCIDFMKKIKGKISVDVIVTSPPYNIKKDYSSYKDNKKKNDYLSWLHDVALKSFLVLKNNGSFFLNIGATHSNPLIPFQIVNQFVDVGYELQNTIHWIKSISFEKEHIGRSNVIHQSVSIGHFKPIISDRYLTGLHEYIFHFTKKGNVKLNKLAVGVPYQDKTNVGRWKSGNGDNRDRGNVWFITYPTIQEGRPHPAVFPERLPYLCIKLHGVRRDLVVYDPFMGIGNTALACLDLGVSYLGTDIDATYVKIANELINTRRKKLSKDFSFTIDQEDKILLRNNTPSSSYSYT
jgi:site-specific DNA-methyltransferase (adenine-specific)